MIPGLGRSPGGGNSNPLQYPWLGNPMDRGIWWATVHGVTKSWKGLSMYTYTHTLSLSLPLPSVLNQVRSGTCHLLTKEHLFGPSFSQPPNLFEPFLTP